MKPWTDQQGRNIQLRLIERKNIIRTLYWLIITQLWLVGWLVVVVVLECQPIKAQIMGCHVDLTLDDLFVET